MPLVGRLVTATWMTVRARWVNSCAGVAFETLNGSVPMPFFFSHTRSCVLGLLRAEKLDQHQYSSSGTPKPIFHQLSGIQQG